MRSYITLSVVALAAWSHAQDCQWLTSVPIEYDMNPSMPNEVMASAPGRLVVGRSSTGDFVYGQTLYGNAMLEALDLDGLPSWSCALSDSVHVKSAVVAADGRAFFAGSFMGAMQLCDGSVLGGIPGQGAWNENLFLLAVNLNTGLVEWTRNLSFVHDQALSVPSLALDPQGRLWYAVSEWGVGKAVRVDEGGADVETRIVDGVRTLGTISFDPWGGLYMSGGCDNNGFAFGGQTFTNTGTTGYSMFVLRFKPDGTAGFAEFADDITFQNPTVVASSDGHAYLAGGLFEATQWGDVELHGPNWSGEIFLTRLDSMGQFLWAVESAPLEPMPITGGMSRGEGPCIALDGEDVLYLIGDARGTTDWGNGVVTGTGTPTDHVLAVVAFGADGSALWSADSEVNPGWGEARTVTAMAEPGSIHIALHIRDPFTFGSHTTGEASMQAAAFAELSGLPTFIPREARGSSLLLTPNPVQSGFVIAGAATGSSAEVLNATGQQVMRFPVSPWSSSIDASLLSTGLYMLRLNDGRTLRFVKE
ncbi:MAG: T9SS type A sorting domain-containing protein [Flavobacteriales bacterium]|nr:T9SS type A sorting domain-containing protein [Flavobacteriales bacterium]